MAVEDATKAASSADIFSGSHTIPQIRAIHRTLQVQIDEKANRLRTQVGNSYRELLGTADTIVQMRGDNGEVQQVLGRMGGRCGRGVIGSKTTGLKKFTKSESAQEKAFTGKALFKLLDNCALVASRTLKGSGGLQDAMAKEASKGNRLIIAAELLVIIRLLVKTLEEDKAEERLDTALQNARRSLSDLRRKLMSAIERALKDISGKISREDILLALSSYSLVNSAGLKDVLQYFLRVRGTAIAITFDLEDAENQSSSSDDVDNALQLYTQTILDVQSLVPAKLTQAFNTLKQQPLLADPVLKRIEGLRLDVYERFCGDDVRYFTPFMRSNDLDPKQARDTLARWAESGAEAIIGGLKATLAQMADFKSIMDLRTRVLQLWIRDGGRAKGFDPSEMQDDLREAINARMLEVLESKVTKLRLVGSEIKATLQSWQDGVTDAHQGLWVEDGYDTALSNGAAAFVQEVVCRLYGRNDAVSRAINSYSSWYHVIDDVKEVVKELRKQRWDNDYDEVEDEETINARQKLLSQDDPRTLQGKLDSTLDRCFGELGSQIRELRHATEERQKDYKVAIYLLRVLRDIRRQLPDRPAVQSFGLDMVSPLQENVASHVVAKVVTGFTASGLGKRLAVSRPLWEGEPALPNQPSTGLFNLLRDLSITMADVGADLWTPAAVDSLKTILDKELASGWRDALHEDVDKATEKDEADTSPDGEEGTLSKLSEEQLRELYTQWAFDLSLLECCISDSGEAGGQLKSIQQTVNEKAQLDNESAKRVTKSSQEFWQRTSLLFGLLA